MPWEARGKRIVRLTDNKVVGHSTSHEKAEAAVRARYANADPKDAAIKAYNKRRMKGC